MNEWKKLKSACLDSCTGDSGRKPKPPALLRAPAQAFSSCLEVLAGRGNGVLAKPALRQDDQWKPVERPRERSSCRIFTRELEQNLGSPERSQVLSKARSHCCIGSKRSRWDWDTLLRAEWDHASKKEYLSVCKSVRASLFVLQLPYFGWRSAACAYTDKRECAWIARREYLQRSIAGSKGWMAGTFRSHLFRVLVARMRLSALGSSAGRSDEMMKSIWSPLSRRFLHVDLGVVRMFSRSFYINSSTGKRWKVAHELQSALQSPSFRRGPYLGRRWAHPAELPSVYFFAGSRSSTLSSFSLLLLVVLLLL